MRVGIVAGSIHAGIRIAREIERIPGVGVFIVVCDTRRRTRFLRWAREILLLLKSFGSWPPAILWKYLRPGRLIILGKALDHPSSTDCLRSLRCDVGLHAANVIYREPTISAFRLGVLNAHIGILPGYRGRSVAEWTILQGHCTGITVFFIDSGIDTGRRIVLREFVSPNGARNATALKSLLFRCDSRLYRRAVEILMSSDFQFDRNDVSMGRRYYVMSRLFTGVVDNILGNRNRPLAGSVVPELSQQRSSAKFK
jgi:formyl transferase-like protein